MQFESIINFLNRDTTKVCTAVSAVVLIVFLLAIPATCVARKLPKDPDKSRTPIERYIEQKKETEMAIQEIFPIKERSSK